jgi:hypothetical protein
MTAATIPQDLLEDAVDAIEHAVREIFGNQPDVPFTSQTDLLSLSPNEEDLVRRAEANSYRERPTISAVNFCLTAAASLLSIAHSLLGQPVTLSLGERSQSWKQLANDTKVAGRAAYRAALVLSDPASLKADDVPSRIESSATPREVQRQVAQREKVLEKSRFYRHWNRVKAENITASQFIEFLRPLADLDGICVSYIYRDEDGDEQIYNHGKESPPHNPLVDAIRKKELTREKALSFALNEEGRVWIESNFL